MHGAIPRNQGKEARDHAPCTCLLQSLNYTPVGACLMRMGVAPVAEPYRPLPHAHARSCCRAIEVQAHLHVGRTPSPDASNAC